MAQQKWIWLVSMRTQVRSLASLTGLRICHGHELWCRSQTPLRSGIAVVVAYTRGYSSDSTPSLGASICHRCGPKTRPKKKKKKKKKKECDRSSQCGTAKSNQHPWGWGFIQSLGSLSGLGIWCWCGCGIGHQMQLQFDLSLGTSICPKCGPKEQKIN